MKINIRTKLLLSFAVVLLLTTAVNIYSLIQMDVLSGLTTKMYNHPLQVTRAVLSANVGIIKMHRGIKDAALATDEAELEAAQKVIKAEEEEVHKQLAIVDEWILGEEGATLIAETTQLFNDWGPIREEVFALMKAGKRPEALAVIKGTGGDHVTLLEGKMADLRDYAADRAGDMYTSAQTTRSRVVTITIMALIGSTVISGGLGWFLSGKIARPLQRVTAVSRLLATGNLDQTIEVSGQDEVGQMAQAFQQMMTYLQDMARAAERLARGDLTTMVTPQSEQDELGHAFSQMITNLRTIVAEVTDSASSVG
ncbi:MAG TPA: MCP four helix bundle domain-containing protein, partial [Anaerolineae bacterium]|nr:MCP four helix bundle domain-containing protein [Anaerolineae bacterium]HMR65364.1 MCP four helix bundle domain-containing protein [Anaerolineae bacterium]